MTRIEAQQLQADAHATGDLLIWTICKAPVDYPGLFTARPHSAKAGVPIDFVLHGPTIDAVRAMLPEHLTRLPRHPDDEPVIQECWI